MTGLANSEESDDVESVLVDLSGVRLGELDEVLTTPEAAAAVAWVVRELDRPGRRQVTDWTRSDSLE